MFGPFADVQFPLLIHFFLRVDCESRTPPRFVVWNVHSDATLCGPNCIFVDCQLVCDFFLIMGAYSGNEGEGAY